MTSPTPRLALTCLSAAALVLLGAASVLAQGTEAEREACTPDALRLCSNTIPDIPRTTACMKAHEAQLSPRCHAVFAARGDRRERARPPALSRPVERAAREDPDDGGADGAPPYGGSGYGAPAYRTPGPGYDEGAGDLRYRYLAPDGREAETPNGLERDRARAEIGRLCDEELIDPRTCVLTERALR